MTAILTTTLSILAIGGTAWVARRALKAPICPICFGVGGTWLWMIVGRSMGYAVDATMLAMLLGGSVVGIAYLVEKRLPSGRSPLLWKMLFIPAGFAAAYGLAEAQWSLFAGSGSGARSARRALPAFAGCAGGRERSRREAAAEDAGVLLRTARRRASGRGVDGLSSNRTAGPRGRRRKDHEREHHRR